MLVDGVATPQPYSTCSSFFVSTVRVTHIASCTGYKYIVYRTFFMRNEKNPKKDDPQQCRHFTLPPQPPRPGAE